MDYIQNLDYAMSRIYLFSAVLVMPLGLILNLLQFLVFKSKEFDKAHIGFKMRVHIFSLDRFFFQHSYLILLSVCNIRFIIDFKNKLLSIGLFYQSYSTNTILLADIIFFY